MTSAWTAFETFIAHASADLNAVWVTPEGAQSAPQLVVVWGLIAAGSTALVVVWRRRQRALERSTERLRTVVRERPRAMAFADAELAPVAELQPAD
jgi:hypothetical protein